MAGPLTIHDSLLGNANLSSRLVDAFARPTTRDVAPRILTFAQGLGQTPFQVSIAFKRLFSSFSNPFLQRMTTSYVPVHAVTLRLTLKTSMKVRANGTIRAVTRRTTNRPPAPISAAVLACHAPLLMPVRKLMTPENLIVASRAVLSLKRMVHAQSRAALPSVPPLMHVPDLTRPKNLGVEGRAVDRKSQNPHGVLLMAASLKKKMHARGHAALPGCPFPPRNVKWSLLMNRKPWPMRRIHPLRCKHPRCEGALQSKVIIITIRVSPPSPVSRLPSNSILQQARSIT